MIHILTGPVHSGKTTLCRRLANELKSKDISVDGFLSLAVEKKDESIGYDLFDIRKESSTPFIRKTGKKDWQRIGSYVFIPETLDKAQKIILSSNPSDLRIIDEIGPLELEGRGIWPALTKALRLISQDFLCVVRNTICDIWIEKLKDRPIKIFDMTEENLYPKMRQHFEEIVIARKGAISQ
ncbi:MAG: nucleoside-triphosphatase [Candidatus Aminicenantes bacterium]|jgi:nucleoside-triphosphatase THEP1